MSLSTLLAGPVAGAQLGIGIAGFRGSRDLARELEHTGSQEARYIRREGIARRAAMRVARASSRGGTAGGGVDVHVGSAAQAEEEDLLMTEFSAERAVYNYAVRAERIRSEGRNELVVGATSAFQTAIGILPTLLDIPMETPKPGIGWSLADIGIDPSEAPFLTGRAEPALFSLEPDPIFNYDF